MGGWVEWLLVGGKCDHLWPLSLTVSVHGCWPSIMSCCQLFCVVIVVVVILGFISLISKYKLSLNNVELEKISSKEASLPLKHLVLFRIHQIPHISLIIY